MSQTASTLLLRNLHDVFGEIDPVRRRAAIDEIFHEDAVFYEPNGAYRGRSARRRHPHADSSRPSISGLDSVRFQHRGAGLWTFSG